MSKILVVGANGNLGKQIVFSLSQTVEVKAGYRDVSKATLQKNVKNVSFDYDNISTYDNALEGVEKVSFISPPLDAYADTRVGPFLKKL